MLSVTIAASWSKSARASASDSRISGVGAVGTSADGPRTDGKGEGARKRASREMGRSAEVKSKRWIMGAGGTSSETAGSEWVGRMSSVAVMGMFTTRYSMFAAGFSFGT